ncbi:MAG: hypothetical protein ACRCZF_21205, partial [Gemmataceae bacterium]
MTHPIPAWHAVLLVLLFAALPAANTLTPTIDPDTYWHLAIGEDIADTMRVPSTEPFSRMGQTAEVPFRAYSWLYEFGLYEVYLLGGWRGLLFARGLLVGFTIAILLRYALRSVPESYPRLFLIALAPVGLFALTTERPWHFTILFSSLTLTIVENLRENFTGRDAAKLL